ncbi:MAG TPA: cohesin domain-containing protein [Ruminococcus sp.]|jgi:hypothetical protein|nr:cohesin domain-containing protein [Ruminococcus sp.]
MKTKKIVIGAMAAAMLSLSICSMSPAFAAGETVQIKVGNATAKAGGQYTVEVSLADIPSTGIQACGFSIQYDSSVISIDKVDAGAITNTGAAKSDTTASLLPNFSSYSDNGEGMISLMWSTSLEDASYWLKSDGVFCTVSGKVKSDAKDGAKAAIKIVPTPHETYVGSGVKNTEIDCGYMKNSKETVQYQVKVTDGSVTVGDPTPATTAAPTVAPTTVAPTSATVKPTKKGDATLDGDVTLADALAILQYVANAKKYPLDAQALANADCDGNAGITANDALFIQRVDAGLEKL